MRGSIASTTHQQPAPYTYRTPRITMFSGQHTNSSLTLFSRRVFYLIHDASKLTSMYCQMDTRAKFHVHTHKLTLPMSLQAPFLHWDQWLALKRFGPCKSHWCAWPSRATVSLLYQPLKQQCGLYQTYSWAGACKRDLNETHQEEFARCGQRWVLAVNICTVGQHLLVDTVRVVNQARNHASRSLQLEISDLTVLSPLP